MCPNRHTQGYNCLRPFSFVFLLFFVSLEMSLFSSIFVPLPFSLCMESASYVFPFRKVFKEKSEHT